MSFSTSKSILYASIIVVAILFMLFVIGEIMIRIFGHSEFYHNKANFDTELGWIPKAHHFDRYTVHDFNRPDSLYKINFQSFENGFRAWGDLASNKPKLWFIGDSFVHALEVNKDQTFFYHIGEALNAEVFAFGQSGYGTLQQKMIVEKYLPIINPDIIIWQTCDNDLINNHLPLELKSNYNVTLRRPFLGLDGKISYNMKGSLFQQLMERSRLLKRIRRRLNQLTRDDEKTIQTLIAEKGSEYKPYSESINITSKIIDSILQTTGDIPVVVFSASAYEPQLSDFKRLWEQKGIPFLTEPGQAIQHLKNKGRNVISKDGFHWNSNGHKKVAEIMIDTLSSTLGLLRSEK